MKRSPNKLLLFLILLILCTSSICAAWSPLIWVSVPRFGKWSKTSRSVQKDNYARTAWIQKNTQSIAMNIYADLVSPVTGTRSVTDYILLDGTRQTLYYKESFGGLGSYHMGRISSENWEPLPNQVSYCFYP